MKGTKVTSLLITLGFIAVFILYFTLNRSDFKILKQVKLSYIILIVCIQFLVLFTNALFLIVNLKVFKFYITWKEAIKTTILTAIGNFFTPFRGGAGIRAVYLKKTYNLSYSTFLSTLAVYYTLIFFINSIVASIGLITLRINDEEVDTSLIIGFLVLCLALASLMISPGQLEILFSKLQPKKDLPVITKLFTLIRNTLDGWRVVIKNKKILLQLFILSIFNVSASILLYYIELSSLGIHIGFLNIIVFSAISSISLLFSITPGSLGIKESLLVLFQTSLALTTTEVLSVSLIDRAINFFLLVVLAILIKLFLQNEKDYKQAYTT